MTRKITPMNNSKNLSNSTREILVMCAQRQLQQLVQDHWLIVGHCPKSADFKPFHDELNRKRREIEAAMKEINHFYTEQFS